LDIVQCFLPSRRLFDPFDELRANKLRVSTKALP